MEEITDNLKEIVREEQKEVREKKSRGEKVVNIFIVLIIGFAIAALFFTAKNIFFRSEVVGVDSTEADHFESGDFTAYDLALAKRLMDKNDDGICDVCGMDVNSCIESGQVQCNMGDTNEKFKIGILDKTKQKEHYHADFKLHINGKEINFNHEKYFVKSRFMHVENDFKEKESTGKVLHMHSSGVPLWLFFESIGMKFEKDCLTLDTEEKYCSNNEKTLKFFVNGVANNEFQDYVFKDDDKILISYGPKGEDVKEQINSITDFAKNH